MSESWSWFCNRCGEGHITSACPADASIRSPFRCEPDPVETIYPAITNIRIPSHHKVTSELLHSLVQALTEQTKAINTLIEQNQLLIQAMAGEEGVEEVDRYQTL